jgi:hypothetical protein
MSKRIEFTLSMPGRNSWNGRWSGESTHYAIVKTLTDRKADELLGGKQSASWGYNFGDGWFASIEARVVPKGERLRKSAGFCGYNWMVSSILDDGEIYGPMNPKPAPAVAVEASHV